MTISTQELRSALSTLCETKVLDGDCVLSSTANFGFFSCKETVLITNYKPTEEDLISVVLKSVNAVIAFSRSTKIRNDPIPRDIEIIILCKKPDESAPEVLLRTSVTPPLTGTVLRTNQTGNRYLTSPK